MDNNISRLRQVGHYSHSRNGRVYYDVEPSDQDPPGVVISLSEREFRDLGQPAVVTRSTVFGDLYAGGPELRPDGRVPDWMRARLAEQVGSFVRKSVGTDRMVNALVPLLTQIDAHADERGYARAKFEQLQAPTPAVPVSDLLDGVEGAEGTQAVLEPKGPTVGRATEAIRLVQENGLAITGTAERVTMTASVQEPSAKEYYPVFELHRSTDVTGVHLPADGQVHEPRVVAVGIVFPNGTVALWWTPPNEGDGSSVAVWPDVHSMRMVHLHPNSSTELVWVRR